MLPARISTFLTATLALSLLSNVLPAFAAGPHRGHSRPNGAARVSGRYGNLSATELVSQAYKNLQGGNAEKSIEMFQEAVRKEPGNAVARRYLSYTLLQQGRAAEAMEQLKVLGSLGKLSGYDLFLTAQALELMGDKKSAAQYYVYAVDEEPSNEFYRLKAIDSLRDLSLYDDATDLVNEGLAMSHDKAVRANYRNKAAQIASARKLVNIQITCHKSLE